MNWLPTEQWRAATPPVQWPRSKALLYIMVRQFSVERHPRYAKTNVTWCNIFVSDVTAALGCPIPHWVTQAGRPTTHDDSKNGAKELNANAMHNWLLEFGGQFGWRQISKGEAFERADAGYPVVASWKNVKGAGHIAMVIPDGQIAQAGAVNFAAGQLEYGFGTDKEILFFTHD